ncbi:hypothetical protein [Parasedimentitalea marina]|uniref:hypothetical protein n=1 Tax=Parasedimentitalea marina TaxID=2483033 RepID=UPI0013E40119|nr:hypothetical protein [Parasedimentitalea marina]
MIDYDRLKQQFSAAQQTWAAADPFPYCTFEGFLALPGRSRLPMISPPSWPRSANL